ncbi:MAG: DUF4140 domain-containing protein, partial [Bacteroidota bacterium]|nr:DUF4140 domain-containing protein [Bacteroidota bacterium]
MNLKLIHSIFLLFAFIFLRAGDVKNSVSSNLKTVTVYRNGAEMTHTSTATLSQGNNDLVIEDISNQLDVNSIQINCPASVTILSVQFSYNYLNVEEVSPRIRYLKDSMEQLQKDLDKITVSITTTIDLLDVLKVNRDIKGSQTGLSVAELIK